MSTTPTRAKRRRQVRIASKLKVPLPPQLQRVNLNAAGVDIGSEEHWAAVPPGRDREGQDVRRFGAFSGDLCALADWLQRCEIETVAMESTGSLLDCALRAVGGAGLRSAAGRCPPGQKRPRAQDRCARLPVAAGVAHLRIVTRCVPSRRSGLRPAQLLAATLDVGGLCLPSHPAYAKSAGADEPKALPTWSATSRE